jgi:hypothetical protein
MEDNGNLDNNFRAADLLLLFQCKDSPAQGKLIIFVKNPKFFLWVSFNFRIELGTPSSNPEWYWIEEKL